MIQVLFALLGGVALVLLPLLFLSFAASAEKGVLLIVLGVLTFFALLGALYLAFSFWLFGFLPIFLLSSALTFYLWRKNTYQEPDFVVEKTILNDALSPDLQEKLTKELESKEGK